MKCMATGCDNPTWVGTDLCKTHIMDAAKQIAGDKIGQGREASLQYLKDVRAASSTVSKRIKRKMLKALRKGL